MSEPNSFENHGDRCAHSEPLAEDVYYQLTPRTPPVNPSDLETGEAAVEVVILWGELSILHVAHISPPRDFYVGDAVDASGKPATDFLIGSESLGTQRLPIVVEHGSRVAVVIPAGAPGEVTVHDQVVSFEELAAQEQLMAAAQPADARIYPLPPGATVRFAHRGFTFIVKQTSAARRIGVGAAEPRSFKEHIWTAASMLVHASLLLSFHFLPPRSSVLTVDLLNADSRLVSYFDQPIEKVKDDKPKWLQDNADAEGGTGKSHADDDGQMGKQDQARTNNKYAIKGPPDNPDPHMARDVAKDAAANAGIIGVLRQNVGAWSSPTSIFGRDTASGSDLTSAMGALMGDQAGANFGFGGLGVRGHGRGGGGEGQGTLGLGRLGTMGHGSGNGEGNGYGQGAGGWRKHEAKVPHIKILPLSIFGSLSKEVIRRTIGRHINEVRYCYEQELNARPDLQGRVTTKFIIAPTGAVQTAAVEKSELGNAKVEQCITQAVRRWSFPAPEGGGIVIVSYPFMLSQTGN